MRTTFVNTLIGLAEKNNQIFLLTGDLGFSVLEPYKNKFPDRFFNMGVAEADMVGVASGLALSGKTVFVYSIASFLSMRCLEQINIDLCYQNLDVKLVGVGGGLCYGSAGPTHHSLVDIAVMRLFPNMFVFCPGDPVETSLVVESSLLCKNPVYIRLGKGCEPVVHNIKSPVFEIGKGIIVMDGDDVTIVATGNMLYSAKCVSDKLLSRGVGVRLISMPCVKPFDKDIVLKAVRETRAIFTMEEHSCVGGLGSVVADVLIENDIRSFLFRRFCVPDFYCSGVGNQNYLRGKCFLSVDQMFDVILGYRRGYDKNLPFDFGKDPLW